MTVTVAPISSRATENQTFMAHFALATFAPSTTTTTSQSIAFIDSQVEQHSALAALIPAGVECVVLDDRFDGMDQICGHLQGRNGVGAIHLISHGTPGTLSLGNSLVGHEYLAAHQQALRAMGEALAPSADVLIYGCNVAAGDVGKSFIEKLSAMLGANVAASCVATGAVAWGGNAGLEIEVGRVTASPLFEQAAYDDLGVLLSLSWFYGGGQGGFYTRTNGPVISASNPVAAYNFRAWQDGYYTISVASPSLDAQLRLFYGADFSAVTPVIDGFYAGGTETTYQYLRAGTSFQIQIGGANYSTGAYTLAVQGPAHTTTTIVTPGPTYNAYATGAIAKTLEEQFFVVTAPSGATTLNLTLTPSSTLNTNIDVLDSAGTYLVNFKSGASLVEGGIGVADVLKNLSVTAGTTYYIAVHGADNLQTGTFSVAFDFNPDQSQNRAPIVALPLADLPWQEGTAKTIPFTTTTFTDPDGNALTYSAAQSSGAALPSWLSFNASTRTFSGTAPTGTPDYTVRVTATDTGGLSAFDDFVLTTPAAIVANRAPVVTSPLADLPWQEGTAKTIPFTTTTFTDPDGNALTYSAAQSSGAALPSWFSFNASTRTFSGTAPTSTPDYTVRVTAIDTGGLSVFDDFVLTTPAATAANRAPVVANQLPNLNWTEGIKYSYTVPSTTFSDPDGNALSYSATLSSGAALPSWLSFNPATRTFSGTAPANSPAYTVRVTATDPGGLKANSDSVFYTPGNFGNINSAYPTGVPTEDAGDKNPYTDSLIWGGSFAKGPGQGATITWTVTDGGTVTLQDGQVVGTTPIQNFELVFWTQAFREWSNVSNVTFIKVAPGTKSDLIEGHYDKTQLDDPKGWLIKPGILGSHETPDTKNADIDVPLAGLFNADAPSWSEEGLAPGGLGFYTLLHEMGHMLGLAHPHDGGGRDGTNSALPVDAETFPGVELYAAFGSNKGMDSYGTNALNQGIWTIMSYNTGWQVDSLGKSTNLGGGEDSFGQSATPMAFDIAAIQLIYGKNTTYKTGNDQYVVPIANAPGTFWSCIWDAGGADTISAATATTACTIDLREAPLTGANAGGYVSHVAGITGGFTIANGAVVENAIGGSGNDTINGNPGNNTLTGGGGIDTLDGGAGIDTSAYTATRSSYTLTLGATTTVQDKRTAGLSDGTDSLKNIERLKFSDVSLALDLNGHAGQAVKLLGTVFGAATVANKQFVGVALSLLDNGMSYEHLATAALGVAGKTSNADVAALLWTNLFGAAPTDAQLASVVAIFDGGMSQGALTVLVADLGQTANNINLVGLSQTGIEFIGV
jgi:hypothetical protein